MHVWVRLVATTRVVCSRVAFGVHLLDLVMGMLGASTGDVDGVFRLFGGIGDDDHKGRDHQSEGKERKARHS